MSLTRFRFKFWNESEKKSPKMSHFFQFRSILSDVWNDIRSQHGCYLSLTCIWISPQMDVAGNRARKTRQGRCPLPLLVFLTCFELPANKVLQATSAWRPRPSSASKAPESFHIRWSKVIWLIANVCMSTREELYHLKNSGRVGESLY